MSLPMSKRECEKWQAEITAQADRLIAKISKDGDATREKLFKAEKLIAGLRYDAARRTWEISDRELAYLGVHP